jgi:phosphomannomutase
MRQMAQRVQGRVETLDGLKVHTPHGWALILPDASESLIHLYVEAGSEADAQRLLEQYAGLITETLAQ